MQNLLKSTICLNMQQYFQQYGHYPGSLDDPVFVALFDPKYIDPLSHTLNIGAELGFTLSLTVIPGDSPNFMICATNDGPYLVYCVDNTCQVTSSPTPPEPSPPPPPSISPAALSLAGEVIVPILDGTPDLIPQVRNYVSEPEISSMIFDRLDSNGDGVITLPELDANPIAAPFTFFVHTGGPLGAEIDSLMQFTPDDLTGDPSYVFSYAALRQLTGYYVSQPGIVKALTAKIDAANASENRGDMNAKAGQLNAFRSQLAAQAGKSLTAPQAHVLGVLSETL